MNREKTKAELWETISAQQAIIDRQLNTLDEFGALLRQANEIERLLQDQINSQRRVFTNEKKELEDELRKLNSRIFKAMDVAEEGSTAAGLISRVAFRLLEQNSDLRLSK